LEYFQHEIQETYFASLKTFVPYTLNGQRVHQYWPLLFKTVFFKYRFSENSQVLDLMKVHPVRAELFRAGRQTGRHDEANSRFMQFREPA
jgi:hypothetical protein